MFVYRYPNENGILESLCTFTLIANINVSKPLGFSLNIVLESNKSHVRDTIPDI